MVALYHIIYAYRAVLHYSNRLIKLPFFLLGTTLTPNASSVTRHNNKVNKQYLPLNPILALSLLFDYKCPNSHQLYGTLKKKTRVGNTGDRVARRVASGLPDYPIFWVIAIWQCEFHLYIKPFAGPRRAVIGRGVAACGAKVKGAGSGSPPPNGGERQGRDTFAIDGVR